jgi:hypothetical protein
MRLLCSTATSHSAPPLLWCVCISAKCAARMKVFDERMCTLNQREKKERI